MSRASSTRVWGPLLLLGGLALAIVLFWLLTKIPKPQSQNRISIGGVLPLSGTQAQYGKWVREGFELALQEINSKGLDSTGKQLHVIWEDDQSKAATAATATTKLINVNKVPLIFGSWASSSVLAQAPIAEQSRVPLLAEAQSPQIRDGGDYIFRIQPDSRLYLDTLAPYAVKVRGLRRLAILFLNNDYGKDQATEFGTRVEQLGGAVVFKEGFTPEEQDFRGALNKIQASGADGVFIPVYAEAGRILRQAHELNVKSQFFGSAPLENPDVVTVAGAGAEGVFYAHHFDPDSTDPHVRAFRDKYRQQFGHEAEGYAALAYDAAHIIADVLKKEGTDRDAIKNGLYAVSGVPGVTGTTTFDDHGDVVKPIVIREIRGGQFRTLVPANAPSRPTTILSETKPNESAL